MLAASWIRIIEDMNNNDSKQKIDMTTVRDSMNHGVAIARKAVDQGATKVHETLARQGLSRPADERVVGGVYSGIGRRLGLGPWQSRVAISAALLVIPGSQILAYPVLWALMPAEEKTTPVPAPAA